MNIPDAFVRAYLECALWSSNDDSTPSGGVPMDQNYSIADIDLESIAGAIGDCDVFRAEAGDMLNEGTPEQAGHDFWLTRNWHGAGFWDGDWPINGDKLTTIAHSFGETNPYVGDDGRIYL